MIALQGWQRRAFRLAFLNLAFLVKYYVEYGPFDRTLESGCPFATRMVGFPPTMEDGRSISHRIFCYLFTLPQVTRQMAFGRPIPGARRWAL